MGRYWAYKPDPDDELSEGIFFATEDNLDMLLAVAFEQMPTAGFDVWDDQIRDWIT